MGYSSRLCSCGESIKSPANLPAAMAWQNDIVVLTPGGSILLGSYDGYGRVSSDEYVQAIQIPEDSQWWHDRCYTLAQHPDTRTWVDVTYTGPSPDAPDQGYFYDRKEVSDDA